MDRDRDTAVADVPASAPFNLAAVRADVIGMLGGVTALDDGADLIALGLDSLNVMRLASRWQSEGAAVRFDELMERPTLADWAELLASRWQAPESADAAVIDEEAPFELATMQHAYWVGRDDNVALGGVSTHFYAEFDGAGVDPGALDTAIRALIQRHAMLRVQIRDDGTQQVMPTSPWPGITLHDLRTLTAGEVEKALAASRDRLAHRRLDVGAGEVFDVSLSLLPGGATRMHVYIDMVVADATSFRIILSDLAELYAPSQAGLPPIGYSFSRYLADRRAQRRDSLAAARDYWAGRLAALPPAPQLPLLTTTAPATGRRVTRRYHHMNAAEAGRLTSRARASGLTPSMVFATAFTAVLGVWSEQPDFVLNVPLFDRKPLDPDVAHLVGDFSNLLIVAVSAVGTSSFLQLAAAVQARVREDAAHAEYSGIDVVRDLARLRGAEGALAPVVFTSALGMGELFGEKVRRCFGEPGWSISQSSQVWLDHQVTEEPGGLLINWDAVDSLFPGGVLDAMFDAYRELLTWLAADGSDWTGPMPSLLAAQRDRRAAVAGAASSPRYGRLHESFFDWAKSDPARPALTGYPGGQVSYGELAASARRVAGLLASRGVGAPDVVAIALPRGTAQIAAVLGVLWAGAAFVPVAVDLEEQARRSMLASTQVRLVLTDQAHCGPGTWPEGAQLLAIEDAGHLAEAPEAAADPDPERLAYISYLPDLAAGLEVSHRAGVAAVDGVRDQLRLAAADRVLVVSELGQELGILGVFAALSAGAELATPGDATGQDRRPGLGDLADRCGATIWLSTPAALSQLLETVAGSAGSRPRLAVLAGYRPGLSLARRLSAWAPQCRLVVLGGATAASLPSTWYPVGQQAAPALGPGGPLSRQKVRIVNAGGGDCPDWVTGELWVGGPALASGYRGQPGLTAVRFVTENAERWYRTGDLARYRPDGTVEWRGGTESRVTVSGQRVDLAEIEAVLDLVAEVDSSVVFTSDDSPQRLRAAVAGSGIDSARVCRTLAGRLPAHMVPESILTLEVLPVHPDGSPDLPAVRQLAASRQVPQAMQPAVGDVEIELATIWAELLEVGSVSRDDSFFMLGGDSLLATRMVARLRREGFPAAQLTELFTAPTLRGYAATLVAADTGTSEPEAISAGGDRYEPFPATDVQRAYWLGRRPEFTLGGVGSHWYWEFDGAGVDLVRLEKAWQMVVSRHDMLRAVFDHDGRQRILEAVPLTRLTVTDGDGAAALRSMRDELSHQVFDPSQWPLFEIRAVRYGGDRTRIGFSLDFVVLDALSIMVVFADLAELYQHPEVPLSPLTISFRDCASIEAADPVQLEAARSYWMERLDDLPSAPELPLACRAGEVNVPRFVRREFRLPAEDWSRLKSRASAHGFTASTVVAAAFTAVLERWSATARFTLNFTLFNRPEIHPEIYKIVGDFTSLLLVANDPVPGESFADRARRLQRQVWSDLQHQAFSGVAVLRELARRRGSAEMLMPVVFTSTIGLNAATGLPFELATPFGEYHWGLSQTPQVWLDHQVTEDRGDLVLTWDMVEQLFSTEVADVMFAAYRHLLADLAAEDADWSAPIQPGLPATQLEVRRAVNDTSAPISGRLLHEGFLDQARRHPERTALLWSEAGRLTYGQLAEWAGRIARVLQRRGVRPGAPVALTLPRGAGQTAAVLAILMAGGVYVPIGTHEPELRRERMHRGAGADFVLTDAQTADSLTFPAGIAVVLLTEADDVAPLEPPVMVDDRQLAYVIYTSGSTGEPKGVEITHRSAVNTVEDINQRFGVGPDDRVLAVSAVNFDLSVYDTFGLLAAGGSLVLIGEEEGRDAFRWRELAAMHQVTLWNSVPTLLEMLIEASGDEAFPASLRVAMVSGDWVGLDLPGRLAAASRGRCRLFALGGATEAAIWSNLFEVDQVPPHWSSIPYGFPLRNQRYRVADPHGADRPDWVPGELWIGGAGVAQGYRGDPQRTAERFVTRDGMRWYRTGDLGRYWPDGTLEFLGRADQQVKIRGHRVELGEIEVALESHPDVERAAAVVLGDKTRRVAAAVVVRGAAPGYPALRAHMARRVPDHMIPQQVAFISELPLTGNGKPDRHQIAALLHEDDSGSAEAVQGATEEALARLWSSLLEVPVTQRHRSFLSLGGDSLLAMRLLERIKAELGADISLRQLLTAPTIAEQALVVAERANRSAAAVEEGII
jgi:yersiniabactin nonribosomal peptide synthetase